MAAHDEFVVDVSQVAERAMEMERARKNAATILEDIDKTVKSCLDTDWQTPGSNLQYQNYLKLKPQVNKSLENIDMYVSHLRKIVSELDSLENNIINTVTEYATSIKDWVFGV